MAISRRKASRSKKSQQDGNERQRSSNRADLLEKAIQSIEGKLEASEVKATFSDFIRLLQLQKEMQTDQPKEIKVTWIEASETESASDE